MLTYWIIIKKLKKKKNRLMLTHGNQKHLLNGSVMVV